MYRFSLPCKRSTNLAVRISDIAKKAGVAKTTVSLVLNRKRSQVRISQQTEQRVLAAARELNYQPSFAARALAQGKTRAIGVLVNSIDNNFYAGFFKYLNDACFQSGYSIFFTTSEFDPGRERRILESFLNRFADGLVITRTADQNVDLIQKISDMGIPIIIEGGIAPTPFPLVTVDEYKLAELAAEFIWSQGHRRILYFTAEQVKNESRVIHFFRRENFLTPWNRISSHLPIQAFATADPTHGGNELAEHLAAMNAQERPTAIVCSTDRLALSLIAGLRMRQIRVPDDISVLGCDDITEAADAPVPLTTLRQPVEKVAQAVWEMLETMLQNTPETKSNEPPPAVYIQPELIVRESTRPCACQ